MAHVYNRLPVTKGGVKIASLSHEFFFLLYWRYFLLAYAIRIFARQVTAGQTASTWGLCRAEPGSGVRRWLAACRRRIMNRYQVVLEHLCSCVGAVQVVWLVPVYVDRALSHRPVLDAHPQGARVLEGVRVERADAMDVYAWMIEVMMFTCRLYRWWMSTCRLYR